MIHGHYCVHPESVDEHFNVASRKRRLERLTALDAPEIILVHERKMYDEQKSIHSDLSCFRASVKKLYADGVENDILDNYRTIFRDVDFDPSIAYSGNDSEYHQDSKDYLKPIEHLTDEALLSFISYVQRGFDEYLEKHTPKLNKIRDLFISRIKLLIDRERYPESVLLNLTRLEQATFEISDGFDTTLENVSGWYNNHRNQIVLSAKEFNGNDALVLVHECFHAIAGRTDEVGGFHRLWTFFDEGYEDACNLLNETFVNAQSIGILTNNPPQWLQDEQLRDTKLEIIIRRTGTYDIPKEIFYNAYFSDNIDEVKKLADAMKSAFNHDALLTDLQSIKDIESISEVKYKGKDRVKKRKFSCEHRFDNIDAYFRYRYLNNPRIKERIFDSVIKIYLAKQFSSESLI